MYKLTRRGFISFALPFLFLFQNCDRNLDLESMNVPSVQSVKRLNISKVTLPALIDNPTHKIETHIDLHEATITDNKGNTYCPGERFFYSLYDILNDSSLCTLSPETDDDEAVLCSTEYEIPKIILTTARGEKIPLGIKNDQCQTRKLCASNQDDFELLIDTFLEIKDSFSCR